MIRATFGALGLLSLAGCGLESGVAPPVPPGVAGSVFPSDAAFSLTVPVVATDTVRDLESEFAGTVALWQPAHGFAVLGLSAASANQVLSNPSDALKLESNQGAFTGGGQLAWLNGSVSAWAGGSVSAWAGGSVSAWAGGMVSAWAGGEFVPVPQNTQKWQQLNLQQGQTLASNLGAGVTVAVIDSGIDLSHPAFLGGLVSTSAMWDFVGNDAVPQEEGVLGQGAYGHGTSVAGIVLQIAPKAKILPLRVLNADGSGDVLDVAAAIDRAASAGAQIINLSLGSDVRSEAVASAIDAATAKGVFVISSSGNTADSQITFPASQANLDTTVTGLFSLSVGSVDALDQKSAFSTFGAALELVAPGEAVYGPIPENRLGAWTGTSMAAPMVSGALALALGEHLSVTLAELTDRVKSRSVNVYQHGQNPAYQDLLGDGRLDVGFFLSEVIAP